MSPLIYHNSISKTAKTGIMLMFSVFYLTYNITDQITAIIVKHSGHRGIDRCLTEIVYLQSKWNSYPWRTIPRGN